MRHPDGIAIDPGMAPPPARNSAPAEAGLVALRTPLGVDQAVAVVSALFRGIVREDSDEFDLLFTKDALAIAPGGPSVGAAFPWWEQRFRRLDYTQLGAESVFHDGDLAIFRGEDEAAGEVVAPLHPPESLDETDIVVKVPIVVTRVGTERLFGDEIVFWLRRDGERYRIYRMVEDFHLQ